MVPRYARLWMNETTNAVDVCSGTQSAMHKYSLEVAD